jgi:hypothetical protein
MELKATEKINVVQSVTIQLIYDTEFKEKCSFAPIGSEKRCSFVAYISPYENDKSIYIMMEWAFQDDDGYIRTALKYYCVEEFGRKLTLEEKYPSWGFEEQMKLITKLQKLNWE